MLLLTNPVRRRAILLSSCLRAMAWHSQVGVKDGVVLLTYSSLISAADSGASRLQQLVDWCKPGFDGLIVFDGENHSTFPVYPTRLAHDTALRDWHAPVLWQRCYT